METHEEVFTWVLKRLAETGLLKGQTIGIDATTLEALATVATDEPAGEHLSEHVLAETVTDKGYHSNETMAAQRGLGIRTYCSEPERKGRRHWEGQGEAQAAVYANRRRIRGERGKRLLRKRGELLERPFAHCYETGGMRRTHLRGHGNILKRLLVHVAGFNLGLMMRKLFGIGKPRRAQDGLPAGISGILDRWVGVLTVVGRLRGLSRRVRTFPAAPAGKTALAVAA